MLDETLALPEHRHHPLGTGIGMVRESLGMRLAYNHFEESL